MGLERRSFIPASRQERLGDEESDSGDNSSAVAGKARLLLVDDFGFGGNESGGDRPAGELGSFQLGLDGRVLAHRDGGLGLAVNAGCPGGRASGEGELEQS